ncbi:MAG: saccharopine dehydrogenase C-terminal domain-containing protein [archaeon]
MSKPILGEIKIETSQRANFKYLKNKDYDMTYDFVVLGATGLQGNIATKDLLKNNYSVLLCGRDKSKVLHLLKEFKKTAFKHLDVRDEKLLLKTLKDSGAKTAINCVEGDWNLQILKACTKNNMNCIDLGSDISITKKQLSMDKMLKRKDLISITSSGSVPGIGNVMLKHAAEKFDSINTIEAGFAWDSNIKTFVVPFSISSIIREFIELAPIIENGRIKCKLPLENIRVSNHKTIGKQKEFPVTHPELYTFHHYFKNKGLKNIRFYAGFPEHSFNTILVLINTGMGSKKAIDYMGQKIKPAEFLTEALKKIKKPKGYKEKENLWVDIRGKKNGKNKKILMECIVHTLKGWEDAGCNIDTGMPASIMAQMIKNGTITARGSTAPEISVPPKPFFKELRKRHMAVFENGKKIN